MGTSPSAAYRALDQPDSRFLGASPQEPDSNGRCLAASTVLISGGNSPFLQAPTVGAPRLQYTTYSDVGDLKGTVHQISRYGLWQPCLVDHHLYRCGV